MLPKAMLTTATTLYVSPTDIESHCVRMIILEKDVSMNQHLLNASELPEDILSVNPYHLLPILFDRKMVLYDFSVIVEYLDERFPFPPLMPVDPIDRAEKRLLLFRFMRAQDSLLALANRILTPKSKKNANEARKLLRCHLIDLTPLFSVKAFFKSDTMTVVDVCLAAILWRLKKMDITLPNSCQPIVVYANKIFAQKNFQMSLSNLESEYR